mmetsp:Transcript_12541/g.25658  ORF Transcript_12541/g.25658 Transcript_12541/m.25658 type:complete len:233 (-) Transcript_12541:1346-2044(-)
MLVSVKPSSPLSLKEDDPSAYNMCVDPSLKWRITVPLLLTTRQSSSETLSPKTDTWPPFTTSILTVPSEQLLTMRPEGKVCRSVIVCQLSGFLGARAPSLATTLTPPSKSQTYQLENSPVFLYRASFSSSERGLPWWPTSTPALLPLLALELSSGSALSPLTSGLNFSGCLNPKTWPSWYTLSQLTSLLPTTPSALEPASTASPMGFPMLLRHTVLWSAGKSWTVWVVRRLR